MDKVYLLIIILDGNLRAVKMDAYFGAPTPLSTIWTF